MNQVGDILALAQQAQAEQVDAVLATVVRTEGSSYRQPGAMMLICEDGRSVGMVSGGCLERHLIQRAFWLTNNGATVQRYQTGHAEDRKAGESARLDPLHALFVDMPQAVNADQPVLDRLNRAENQPPQEADRGEELVEGLAQDFSQDSDDNVNDFDDFDDFDEEQTNFGLGCNGSVYVLFERLADALPLLERINHVRNSQQPLAVATLIKRTVLNQQRPIVQPLPTPSLTSKEMMANASAADFATLSSGQPSQLSNNESSELTLGTRYFLTQRNLQADINAQQPLPDEGKELPPAVTAAWPDIVKIALLLSQRSGAKARFQHLYYEHDGVAYEWLVQYVLPPIHLLICGAGNDALPMVKLAKMLDWRVSVIDSRTHYATRSRFYEADWVQVVALEDEQTLRELSHDAAVAIMSHSLSQDRARLKVLLQHPPRYLGQLGPSYRTERLISEIADAHPNPAQLRAGVAQLHYPIGYKLGGDTPEALALGIIAQISAVMYQQPDGNRNHDQHHLSHQLQDPASTALDLAVDIP